MCYVFTFSLDLLLHCFILYLSLVISEIGYDLSMLSDLVCLDMFDIYID